MTENEFFKRINFNKDWTEEDWEKYFQAEEAYRLSLKNSEVKQKQAQRIKFQGHDEVEAFEPVLRAYGIGGTPSVVYDIHNHNFAPIYTDEGIHFWEEGTPLASLNIYRDCCRLAVMTQREMDAYLKRRGEIFKKKFSSLIESLRFHTNWVPLNVAQGHLLGYSEDRLNGNIAKCKRALHHVDMCIRLLNRLSTRSDRIRRNLFSLNVQVRRNLYRWIDQLRATN